ncbi:hypothetical protein BC936DRAFT_149914 [Jimgerdemannia flammicorona]|uniref:RING-type domain-containing protein n=1 Tax=Jimgerdemannia flammicorona TaxID=994334 RepID=A0A433DJW8_9FUNG|nr:hypothetical protein BC936DRAFT_149914 [Jimgerdemannia flammicorona]
MLRTSQGFLLHHYYLTGRREIVDCYLRSGFAENRGDTFEVKFQNFQNAIGTYHKGKTLQTSRSKALFAHFIKIHNEMLTLHRRMETIPNMLKNTLLRHDERTGLRKQPLTNEDHFYFEQSRAFDHVASRMGAIIPLGKTSHHTPKLLDLQNPVFSLLNVMETNMNTIVPQATDYSCPICLSILRKPIRLSCGHLFCLRCMVKAQAQKLTHCPLCRSENAIIKAHAELAEKTKLDAYEQDRENYAKFCQEISISSGNSECLIG